MKTFKLGDKVTYHKRPEYGVGEITHVFYTGSAEATFQVNGVTHSVLSHSFTKVEDK